ncbi:MAG: hypothetical protein U9R43_15290 [Thermodesulfobacteriota bacterium]|nr:hypothetical protein [Thermodesulfobacteriota bacterium]
MKKPLFVSICILFLFLFSMGTVFALQKAKPMQTKQQLVLNKSSCEKLLSVKNDGSMPKGSLTQRYQVVCSNKGKKATATIEVNYTKEGKIKYAKVVSTSKAMGGGFKIFVAMDRCEVTRCVTVCEFPPGGTPFCYYV